MGGGFLKDHMVFRVRVALRKLFAVCLILLYTFSDI